MRYGRTCRHRNHCHEERKALTVPWEKGREDPQEITGDIPGPVKRQREQEKFVKSFTRVFLGRKREGMENRLRISFE